MLNDSIISMHNVQMLFKGTNGSRVEVLRNFSLAVNDGETLAVVGPSGCGKTTILKLLSGLLSPTQGRLLVGGSSTSGAKLTRDSSFMFQQPVLLPWLTVRQNVQLPGRICRDKEGIEKADSLIALVGLGGFEDAYPRQLSGGMQSRAALARALSLSPKILLMDEPFGALDDMTRNAMQDETLNIIMNTAKTVVLVTHSIEEAVYMSDRVIVLSKRPATILLDISIRLQKPREWHLKAEPSFLEYRTKIKEKILNGISLQGEMFVGTTVPPNHLRGERLHAK